MDLYFISLKRDCRADHDAGELTRVIEALPGAEILDGRNEEVLTVNASAAALGRIRDIGFANVERYRELDLL